jgi:dynein heavy chain
MCAPADIIRTKNSAAGGLCSFVINIIIYYDIVVTVEPKRLALAEANAQMAEAQAKLSAVNAHVAGDTTTEHWPHLKPWQVAHP